MTGKVKAMWGVRAPDGTWSTTLFAEKRRAEEWARFCDRYSDEPHRVVALVPEREQARRK